MKVLIVEDDILIGRYLQMLMAELGHEVCATATSADDAITQADACHPDVALWTSGWPTAAAALTPPVRYMRATGSVVFSLAGRLMSRRALRSRPMSRLISSESLSRRAGWSAPWKKPNDPDRAGIHQRPPNRSIDLLVLETGAIHHRCSTVFLCSADDPRVPPQEMSRHDGVGTSRFTAERSCSRAVFARHSDNTLRRRSAAHRTHARNRRKRLGRNKLAEAPGGNRGGSNGGRVG